MRARVNLDVFESKFSHTENKRYFQSEKRDC